MRPPKRPPRPPKAVRQQDQRRVNRERLAREELRRRVDRPDLVPVREEEGRYRP